MPLAWSEIRARAIAFIQEWRDVTSEAAEKQSYWNEFFAVFGKKRRAVAAFEEPVRKLSGSWGRIDLFWPGTLLVEHKSAGENLGKAHSQGLEYIRGLVDSGRESEAPRYLIVSDFQRIALHDLEPEEDPDLPLFKRLPPTIEFPLADLPKHVHAFGFLAGYRTFRLKEEDPANIEAAELLAELHDVLEAGGYPASEADRFLVRVLFCLFAEDTGIFEANPRAFTEFLQHHTVEDGSDLGLQLEQLFRILDTPPNKRGASLPEHLAEFPYVNGRLFAARLSFANFNRDMRNQLLACASFNWSRISPAIFGSLFQSIMAPRDRRQIGAHYTTERDILKLLRSLFLEDLHAEFAQIKADRSGRRDNRLAAFQRKLAGIKILDPACGCGNFLILAYRELRRLETQTLSLLRVTDQAEMDFESVARLAQVDVDQLHGIEIGEWPARIAEVAIWLMDHLCNQELSAAFGVLYRRLPLTRSANIAVGNALRLDWSEVLPAVQCTYVLGNPPFVGKKEQDARQKADMAAIWGSVKGAGILDYVTAWYRKATDYTAAHPSTRCAFVSTNSISQGEQVAVLWGWLLSQGIRIQFAHRTFPWTSEARGKARVHVVIIGFARTDPARLLITEYDRRGEHPKETSAANISPYLIDGRNILLENRRRHFQEATELNYGSFALDDGHFTISDEEASKLKAEAPRISR